MSELRLHEKLKKYLDDNGIRMSWFATKIGIGQGSLSKFLMGKGKLPKKSWKKVVMMTRGKITMKEILNNFLEDVQDVDHEKNKNNNQ